MHDFTVNCLKSCLTHLIHGLLFMVYCWSLTIYQKTAFFDDSHGAIFKWLCLHVVALAAKGGNVNGKMSKVLNTEGSI